MATIYRALVSMRHMLSYAVLPCELRIFISILHAKKLQIKRAVAQAHICPESRFEPKLHF